MRPSAAPDRPAHRPGLLRRLRRAAVAVPLGIAMGLGAMTVLAPSASAHGSVTDPPSRNYGCWERWGDDHLNPEMATLDPMCWQAFQADPNTMWNWNGLFREGVAGRHEQVIPDGQLCSGGETFDGRYASLDAVGPWTAKEVPNSFHLTLTDGAKHGADYLKIYVTKQGFDPTTEPLTWADMELVQTTGRYPTTGLYETDIDLPGRSGRAVLYTIWQASHLDQSYYLCSDIIIGDGGPTTEPTQEPTSEPTDEPTSEPTDDPTSEPTDDPTTEPTQEPTSEPTDEPTGQPTGACTATVTVNSSWPGGYVADVVVTAGADGLSGWDVTVGGATITQAWGGTASGNVITNESWNGTLAPGGKATAGFIGSGSATGLTATCAAA